MLSLARNAAQNTSRLLKRSVTARTYAQVVPATTSSPTELQTQPSPTKVSTYSAGKGKVPIREDHGLYAFFRQKPNVTDLRGEEKYLTLETPEMQEHLTGRDWKASELRLKSFRDLHTLWYVLLRERNLLATQRAEARRSGVDKDNQVSKQKQYCVRISMARIKAVLNERRLAYEGAVELLEAEQDVGEEEKILQYLERARKAELDATKKYSQRRRTSLEPPAVTTEVADSTPAEVGVVGVEAVEVESSPATATSEPTPIAEESQVVRETVQQTV